MKNERYIRSVGRIAPDEAAQERMLARILETARPNHPEARKADCITKTLDGKRLATIAACFVLVAALVGVFGSDAGLFGGKIYTAGRGGAAVSFHKAALPPSAEFVFDFNVTSRDLAPDEIKALFGDAPATAAGSSQRKTGGATAYATFNAESHSFLRLEGKIGGASVIVAAQGAPVTDTIIAGNENISDVYGTPVTAGYFVTKENSQGVKTIVFFAAWALGDVTEYVELAGNKADSETLSNELAAIIERLVQNGAPDLSAIAE